MVAVLVLLVILFAVVAGRLTQLQLLEGDRYAALGASQRVRPVTLPAERGSVFDRDGRDLALSVPQKTVWADPRLVADPQRTAAELAPVLNMDEATVLRQLTTPGAFVYLKRQVDETTAATISGLKLPGVDLIDESKRFNPSGTLGLSLLGGVDIDNKGIAGLEKQYDSMLTGTPGELVLERDPSGRTIATGQHRITPAKPGDDLVLTIDQAMQFETERALGEQIVRMGAKGGIAIVSNPKTGEILAMASMDKGTDGAGPTSSSYNKALTNVFEPGSANKIITMAAALEEGTTTPTSQLEVTDKLDVADFTFSDHDPHDPQIMTPTDILATSSNVGTIMLGQQLGAQRLDEYLRKFGFGSTTSLGFPDESGGLLLPLNDWSGTSIGTIPIGQGVAITALQMLQAYNVIANGGLYVDPKLVLATIDQHGQRHDTPVSGSHRVVSTKTANEVRDMMVAVVDVGTGKHASIDGYTVGGKTGTARKPLLGGGYRDGAGNYHYVATFAGFTPAEDPQLSAIVVLDEPSNDIYGGDVSAPVFSRVVSYALRRFAIPPPGVALKPTVPAPKLVEGGDVPVADVDTRVRQAPAPMPTTTTTTTTVPAATGPPGKKP